MSQQITIILMIDTEAAIRANKLEENIYMFDSLRTEGSKGAGTGNLITSIIGNHWCDGSQASQIILNWVASGIGSFPQTLPKHYYKNRTKSLNDKLHAKLNYLKNEKNLNSLKQDENLINMTMGMSKIKNFSGKGQDYVIRTLTSTGKPYIPGKTDESISYLNPIITDITGEAVYKGVIFPAQYGSPGVIKNGWYWSAGVDTSKVGIYSYTLRITVYKPKYVEEISAFEWEPIQMMYDSNIRIASEPKINGFTNGFMGELPIY